MWPFKRTLARGTIYHAVQDGSCFWVCGWNSKKWPSKWKLPVGIEHYFPVPLFIELCKVFPTFESVDGIPKCDLSNENYQAVCTFSYCSLFYCTWWFRLWSLWLKPLSVDIQVRATEHYLAVVLFIILYEMVLIFELMDLNPKEQPFKRQRQGGTSICFKFDPSLVL